MRTGAKAGNQSPRGRMPGLFLAAALLAAVFSTTGCATPEGNERFLASFFFWGHHMRGEDVPWTMLLGGPERSGSTNTTQAHPSQPDAPDENDTESESGGQAIVRSVQGDAQWSDAQDATGGWKLLKVDDRLPPGSAVRTGLDSSAELEFGGSGTVKLKPGTKVTIEKIGPVDQQGDPPVQLALNHGSLGLAASRPGAIRVRGARSVGPHREDDQGDDHALRSRRDGRLMSGLRQRRDYTPEPTDGSGMSTDGYRPPTGVD